MLELVRCFFRTSGWFLCVWVGSLSGLLLVVPHAYRATYPDAAELRRLADPLRGQLGFRVLYGVVPDPLTVPSFAMWELGSWVTLLGCVMSLLLGVRFSRAAEESGLFEVLCVSGNSQRLVNFAVSVSVFLACCILGFLCALALFVQGLFLEGFDFYSSLLAGKVFALATACFGGVGVLCSQFSVSARGARGLGFVWLGLAFLIRVVADVWGVAWLRWCSPLAWRDLVRPFDGDVAWPLVVMLGVAFACFAPGLVPRDLHSTLRVDVALPHRLLCQLRLIRAWGLAVGLVTVSLFALTGEMRAVLEDSPGTAALVRTLTGIADAQSGYLAFLAVPVGILVVCAAVQFALATARDEGCGVVTLEVACGNPRFRPLLVDFGVSVVATAVIVGVVATLAAGVAEFASNADLFESAWWSVADHVPAACAAAGLASLCTGCSYRWSSLAWAPVAVSGLITLFGSLLDFPGWLLDASLFAWPASDHPSAALGLVGVGVAAACLGALAFSRRDLRC